MTVNEDLPPSGQTNTGSYTSTISCDELGIQLGRGGQAASGVVPDEPVPVLCTVTNTRTSASLVLQKAWVNGATGDIANLSIDGATAGSGFADATVPAGGTGLSIDKATVTLLSGDAVDLAEQLGAANDGSYTSQIICNRPGLTPDGDGQGGSFQVPAIPEPVTCTITNTRTSASLILQKAWANGAAGDTAALAVSGSGPATSGSATSTSTGAAGSATDTVNRATATIFSGQMVNLAETLGAGNTGAYTSQITCDQPVLDPDDDGRGGIYTVPDTPVAVTCTITNTRTSAVLTLQKTWVNGAARDTAALAVSGSGPPTSGSATSAATGAAGSETDTVNRAAATVFSGQAVNLAETLGAGNIGTYTSQIACDQTGLTPDGDGQGGSYLVPGTPAAVTCTITNTRTSAAMTLQKTWVNGAADDTADLTISGSDPATTGSATSTATGTAGSETDTVNRAAATVFSGQAVNLAETLGAGNIGTYTSQIACDQTGLTPDGDGQGGSYLVPGTPAAVTCTITNTRTSAAMTLQKTWVNGAFGDTAGLAIAGPAPVVSVTAVSTASGASGSETDTANVATTTVFSGQEIGLAELLNPGNTGSYTSQITCDQTLLEPSSDGRSGIYTVPATPAAVTCTITNTRTSATLILQKTWVNGAAGDTTLLSITGVAPETSEENMSTATGAPGSETDTDHQAVATVYSGQTLVLGEIFGASNIGTYAVDLTCTDPDRLLRQQNAESGTYTVPLEPSDVTCTFTNSRRSTLLILQKGWVDAAAGDTAGLTIATPAPGTPASATSTATGAAGSEIDAVNRASATVFSGQAVPLDEVLGSGNTGSYTSQIVCDQPGLTPDGDGQGGSYQVPAIPLATTCTVTNSRTSTLLILQKGWVDAAAGDTAGLTIATPAPGTPASATSTATGAVGSEIDTVNRASATVFSGQAVPLDEVLGAGNTGSYTSQIVCDQPGLTPDGDGQGGSYQVPAIPLATTCTVTNSRTSTLLILQKGWVDAAAGDTAGLTIATPAPGTPASATSTATGAVGSEIDTVNRATATVFSGQAVPLDEVLGAGNTGSYTSQIVCDQPGLIPDGDGQGGSYEVPDIPVSVTCTITNTRTAAQVILRKEWVDAAVGDTTDLTITGSDLGTVGSATSTATGAAGSEIDTVNQATATVYSGGTVDLVEAFGTGNTGSYSSQIVCSPADGFTAGQGGQGGSYEVPDTPVPVSCTVTNTRTSTSLILQKVWVNGAAGDTADLSIGGATTGSGFATAVVPANGNGLSTDKATAIVLSGDTVELAEDLGAANTGTYTSQLECDQPGLTPTGDGRGGTYQVSATAAPVNCTFTNAGPPSVPTVTKTVTATTQNADGSWTIIYDVAVTNAATAAMTHYTLTDELAFGAGIDVNSATVEGPADETVNPNWNGDTDVTLVTSGTLLTGETDSYTVTVNADVTADATAGDRACSSGGGFLNKAHVGLAPPELTVAAAAAATDQTTTGDASACAEPVSPTIVKNAVASAQHPGDATWDVTYTLSVTNPATTTGLVYSLTDTPGFPEGVSVNTATVIAAKDSAGQPITDLINTWDGSTLSIVGAKDLAAGVTDTYTVVINTTGTAQDVSNSQCQAGGSAHGYVNTGAVTSGADSFTAQACIDIRQPDLPPAPTPTPPTPPAPLPPPLAYTGVAVTEFLMTAFGLVIMGTLLLMVFRRRTPAG